MSHFSGLVVLTVLNLFSLLTIEITEVDDFRAILQNFHELTELKIFVIFGPLW